MSQTALKQEDIGSNSVDSGLNGATTDKTVKYSQLTPFKPGQSGNLNGRPKGSRNKLSETFLADVHALWLTHGNQALQDMLADSPTKFCQMISAILPKHVDIESKDGITWVINAAPALSTDEWLEQHNLIEQDKDQ